MADNPFGFSRFMSQAIQADQSRQAGQSAKSNELPYYKTGKPSKGKVGEGDISRGYSGTDRTNDSEPHDPMQKLPKPYYAPGFHPANQPMSPYYEEMLKRLYINDDRPPNEASNNLPKLRPASGTMLMSLRT